MAYFSNQILNYFLTLNFQKNIYKYQNLMRSSKRPEVILKELKVRHIFIQLLWMVLFAFIIIFVKMWGICILYILDLVMNIFYSLNNLLVENVSTQREKVHRSWHSLDVSNVFYVIIFPCTSLQAFNFWIFCENMNFSPKSYKLFSFPFTSSLFSLPLIFSLNCHYFEKGETERESGKNLYPVNLIWHLGNCNLERKHTCQEQSTGKSGIHHHMQTCTYYCKTVRRWSVYQKENTCI